MLDWFKRKPPPKSEGNPGHGAQVTVGFSNAERSWSEQFNLIDTMESVLAANGIFAKRDKNWLSLESGLVLQPQIVHVQPLDDGHIRTTTTVDVSHPKLAAAGVFEFQHAQGESAEAAARQGLEGWAALDLPVFMDALREKAQHCMILALDPKAESSRFPAGRRIVLGPTSHVASRPADVAVAGDHDFCPCCLFTRNHATFWPLLEGKETCGIRFFASRDAEGVAQADCRVNGLDWEPGKTALIDYVGSWPQRGLEFRKQFGLIHSLPL